jgi:DNA polymerase
MTDLSNITDLEQLWEHTFNLHKNLYPQNKLAPIMAGGRTKRPKFMFVFINPTYRNISSDPRWDGKRRPWTGTKYIWKIFNTAGLFDDSLLNEISNKREWDPDFADKVYSHLNERSFYFTNLVKWTGDTGDLPDKQKVNTFLPIMLREIELVEPDYIITFGLIPFNALINEPIKLKDYFDECYSSRYLKTFDLKIQNNLIKVIPCYFPVGRGDPNRAIELLKLLPV